MKTNLLCHVASFTDAWIETLIVRVASWVILVASFTDAWIETSVNRAHYPSYQSHLLQMRGLKLTYSIVIIFTYRRIFYRCVD